MRDGLGNTSRRRVWEHRPDCGCERCRYGQLYIGEVELVALHSSGGEEGGRPTCPRCGEEGSGLYTKMVKNRQKRIYHYKYFAHKSKSTLRWCYIGR